MKESAVERKLIREIRRRGGLALKLFPFRAGIPDRLLLLPGGRAEFVELKAVDGKLSPIQEIRHEELKRLGFPVTTIYGSEGVTTYIQERLGQ